MAIFAGKFIYGAAFELQSRVFMKPCRVKKIIVRCCSNLGENSKDFPVRYKPKRSSKSNKSDEYTPTQTDSENYELRRSKRHDSPSVEYSNAERLSMGLVLDEKSSDFKSGKLESKEVEYCNSDVKSEVGEHYDKQRSVESNCTVELDECDSKEGSEEVVDELDPRKVLRRYKPTRSSTETENYEIRRFTNHDLSHVEYSNADRLRRGLFLDENPADNDFKSDKLEIKEEVCNSTMNSEVGDHYKKWRSVESSCLEELHSMEDSEEVLDELDTRNGSYEIKHFAVEPGKTKEEAEKAAIRLLAARAYTAVELKKKLLGKKFSHEVVNAVISDFQNRGLINDFSYAEAFSRSRWSSSSWGPRRIKQALSKKGVSDFDAQKAIKSVFEDGEPNNDDQVSRLGLSKPSLDHLFAQASKQWLRAKDLPIEKQKSRIISWLQYRGFNWSIISFILKKLLSEHSP